ncbi:hypothetical protein CVT24_008565 [Panaeolus cyanescens]|uniref:Uncharacterized protein n=1 Tax=Panaeolus cyanescens TaxID=181874 RepID=A0A409VB63_9AGAR|nr:hypothetical protein CVT24_008565 [Panaeolus cyanescens]
MQKEGAREAPCNETLASANMLPPTTTLTSPYLTHGLARSSEVNVLRTEIRTLQKEVESLAIHANNTGISSPRSRQVAWPRPGESPKTALDTLFAPTKPPSKIGLQGTGAAYSMLTKPIQPPKQDARALNEVKEELARLKAELKRRTDELDRYRAEMGRVRVENLLLSDEVKKRNYINDILSKELDDFKNNHTLVANGSPSMCISDIEAKVQELNDEIYQAALRLSKAVIYERPRELSVQDRNRVYAHVEEILGQPLALTLAKEARRSWLDESLKAPNPFLVCTVIRVHMIHICMTIIDKWIPNPEISKFLDGLFLNVYKSRRPASISEKLREWRSMTRENIKIALGDWDEGAMLASLRVIFGMAHWRWFDDEPDKLRMLNLKSIHHFLMQLMDNLRLEIDRTPAILRISTVAPSTQFNSSWMSVDCDLNDDFPVPWHTNPEFYRVSSQEKVAAAVGLGLKRLMNGDQTRLCYHVIMLPTVLLQADLLMRTSPIESWMCGKDA